MPPITAPPPQRERSKGLWQHVRNIINGVAPLKSSGRYYRGLVSGQFRGLSPVLQRSLLRLASVPYGWASGLRNWLFDKGWKCSRRVPVPVVSVGNLTLGGTGKTPCVELIARFYRQRQLRVAILSRGYRGRG